jgi:lysophospholipase L1-like esterase
MARVTKILKFELLLAPIFVAGAISAHGAMNTSKALPGPVVPNSAISPAPLSNQKQPGKAPILRTILNNTPATIATPTPGPIGPSIIDPGTPNSFETEVESIELRRQGAPTDPIVFYGSSSIRFWKTLQQDFTGYPVYNCGFGGSRLTDCIQYANRLVLKLKPRAVIIYAGDNDLATGTPPDQVFDSFQRLFRILRSYSSAMPIAFISVKPCPARMRYFQHIMQFNQMVDEFLADQPNAEYIDIYTAFMDSDHQPNPALFRNDKIHLSTAGYDILRKDVGEFLQEEFTKNRTTSTPAHTTPRVISGTTVR